MRRLTSIGAAVVLAGCLGACFGGSPQPRYYALEPAAPERAPGKPYPVTLLVRRFDAAIAYDRSEIVFRQHEHELSFYEYRLWIAKPGRMLSEAIANHLSALGLFQAVTLRSTERSAHYELSGKVLAIDELDAHTHGAAIAPNAGTAVSWKARLSFKLVLSSIDSGEVVWERAFETVRVVAEHDPRAVVATLTAILEDDLGRITTELDHVFANITQTHPRFGFPTTATP